MSKKKEIKKSQYYVWYLGWKECRGIWGREITEPIVRELIARRRHEELPKLTVEVSRKELRIVQLVERKKGKVEKIKYPPIPSKDVTYAVQALEPDGDVVACIYLGYNPQTRCAVHVHVYRCDSPDTAGFMVEHLNQLIEIPEHQARVGKIEAELVNRGQVVPRPSNISSSASDYSTMPPSSDSGDNLEGRLDFMDDERDPRMDRIQDPRTDRMPDSRMDRMQQDSNWRLERPSSPGRELDRERERERIREHERLREHTRSPGRREQEEEFEEVTQIYDNLAAELKERLGSKTKAPILLPPKDYDTVHRNAGKIMDMETRKALNINIVGPQGIVIKKRFARESGGDDSDGSNRGSRHSKGSDENPRGSWGDPHGRPLSTGLDPPLSSNGYEREDGRGSNRSSREADEEILTLTQWKRETLLPPASRSPRGHSPSGYMVEGNDRGRDHERGRERDRPISPNRLHPNSYSRPLSPPPELRQSYFPESNPLPGYLTSDRNLHDPHRSRSPDRDPFGPGPTTTINPLAARDNPYGSYADEESIYGSNKKYSASNLGLTKERGPPPRGRPGRADEGYTSMERRAPSDRGYYDEDPYSRDPPYGSHAGDPIYNRAPRNNNAPSMVTSMPTVYQAGSDRGREHRDISPGRHRRMASPSRIYNY